MRSSLFKNNTWVRDNARDRVRRGRVHYHEGMYYFLNNGRLNSWYMVYYQCIYILLIHKWLIKTSLKHHPLIYHPLFPFSGRSEKWFRAIWLANTKYANNNIFYYLIMLLKELKHYITTLYEEAIKLYLYLLLINT